jgi:hypothetical protein
MTEKPMPYRRRLKRPVVIHDQKHIKIIMNALINDFQKPEEFLATMRAMQATHDLTGGNIQRGKPGRRAVSHVIVRPSLRNAGANGKIG